MKEFIGILLTILLSVSGVLYLNEDNLTVESLSSEYKVMSSTQSVEFITYEEFYDVIKSPNVVVIEYWATWNKENQYPLRELYGAELYRVDVDKDYQLVEDFGVSTIPTLLIFKNGYLEHMIETDISFERKGTSNYIQEIINSLN